MTSNYRRTTEWLTRHRLQLRLAARMVVASLVTFTLCNVLELPQSQWAVLTAIVVMHGSVGASLKATMDRFIGSLGGAVWGVCILLIIPRDDVWALGVALAGALIPLSVLAAWKPAYRVAPITAVILLLIPDPGTLGPFHAAMQRMLEVGLGSAVAMAVALSILPGRAHDALADASSGALALLADLMTMLIRKAEGRADAGKITRLHHDIREAIAKAERIAEEANRERRTYLIHAPDPFPICRNLRRLRHDVTMIGRALEGPLAKFPETGLDEAATDAVTAISAHMHATARAIANRQPPPDQAAVRQALSTAAATMAIVRRRGATRELSDDMVSRIFSLAFALEQMSRNLKDLEDRTTEFAGL